MTIIQPKRSKRRAIQPAIPVAICCIMILAAANVIAYDRVVGVRSDIKTEQKTLESAQAKNAALKKQWYEAVDTDNLKALVKEYGFVKIASPGYLPS